MSKGLQARDGWIQLAIAVGYALAYMAIRPFSDSHWTLTSGLRMACLLLLPYRYWPALAVGEVFPLTYLNYKCVHAFGFLAFVIASISPIITGMPVVWWCRSRLALFPSRRLVDIQSLLLCSLLVSIVWASISYAILLIVPSSFRPFKVESIMWVGLFIGSYIAILAIVPWTLLVREAFRNESWRGAIKWIMATRLLMRDTLLLVVPVAGFAWLSYAGQGDIVEIARMAMFLPVAWVTLKHGWWAAVLGGTMVVACISLMLESKPDPAIFQIQAFMAITITCLYALSSRISAQIQQRQRERFDILDAKKIAKKNLCFGENRMRQVSQALECVLGVLRIDHDRVQERLSCVTTEEERSGYDENAMVLQQSIFHLAESIYPSVWRKSGLQDALCDTIGNVLHDAGVVYHCDTKGGRLDLLQSGVQAAIYRTACEAIACVSSPITCARVQLTVRSGRTRGRCWAMLRIDGILDDLTVARSIYHALDRERVAPKLGAHALKFEELRDYVRLFDGELRIRSMKDGVRITALFHDENQKSPIQSAVESPIHLWVG